MLILLEGPDGAGKTTFAETIIKEYNYGYLHYGAYENPTLAFQAYEKLADEIIRRNLIENTNLVLDRLHISEWIYGRAYHGRWMSESRFVFLERQLEKLKTVVVCCLPSSETVLTNWKKGVHNDDEMITDESQLLNVYNSYIHIRKFTRLPVLNYSYENESMNNMFPVMDEIRAVRDQAYGV